MLEFVTQFKSLMTGVEWVAFISGVICVYLIVREKDINWPIGVFNSILLAYIFWTYELYAQVGLQIVYVFECFYGWYRRVTGVKLLRIGRTGRETAIWLAALSVLGTMVCYGIFRRTGDPAPFWDSLISVLSLIAEYMLCLKLTEAWIIYVVADIISLFVLAALGQWVTFGTYLCFTFLCLLGVKTWWRKRSLLIVGEKFGENHMIPLKQL